MTKPEKITFDHLDKAVIAKALIEVIKSDERFDKECFNSTTPDVDDAHKKIANCVIHLLMKGEFSFNQQQSEKFFGLFNQEVKEIIIDDYMKVGRPRASFDPKELKSFSAQESNEKYGHGAQ